MTNILSHERKAKTLSCNLMAQKSSLWGQINNFWRSAVAASRAPLCRWKLWGRRRHDGVVLECGEGNCVIWSGWNWRRDRWVSRYRRLARDHGNFVSERDRLRGQLRFGHGDKKGMVYSHLGEALGGRPEAYPVTISTGSEALCCVPDI